MKGKTVLVTGATAGMGRITARELAAGGARVLLVARNQAKAEETRNWITAQTGSREIELLIADLSVLSQVRSTAEQARSQAPAGIDVLVNNVGAVFQRRQESADGIEMTFALNHLAPFLLTNLLIESLRRRSGARVVTVSSHAHVRSGMDFDDLEGRKRYRTWEAYGKSKLANLLFTYELARRLAGTGVTANALHPGFVASEFGRNNGAFLRTAISISMRLFGRTVEEGARTSIYLASCEEVARVSGKYFVDCRVAESSPASRDPDSMRKLWEISAQMTGLAAAD